jgi:hypothetical protein
MWNILERGEQMREKDNDMGREAKYIDPQRIAKIQERFSGRT